MRGKKKITRGRDQGQTLNQTLISPQEERAAKGLFRFCKRLWTDSKLLNYLNFIWLDKKESNKKIDNKKGRKDKKAESALYTSKPINISEERNNPESAINSQRVHYERMNIQENPQINAESSIKRDLYMQSQPKRDIQQTFYYGPPHGVQPMRINENQYTNMAGTSDPLNDFIMLHNGFNGKFFVNELFIQPQPQNWAEQPAPKVPNNLLRDYKKIDKKRSMTHVAIAFYIMETKKSQPEDGKEQIVLPDGIPIKSSSPQLNNRQSSDIRTDVQSPIINRYYEDLNKKIENL